MTMAGDQSCDPSECIVCILDHAQAPLYIDPVDRPPLPAPVVQQQAVCNDGLPIWHVFMFIVFFMLAISNVAGLVLIWSIAMVATGWHAIWCLVRNLEDGAP